MVVGRSTLHDLLEQQKPKNGLSLDICGGWWFLVFNATFNNI
jgi:hypothetical protein